MTNMVCEGLNVLEMGAGSIAASLAGMLLAGRVYNDGPMASTGAGRLAFAGSLAALTAREQSGRGQRVDATMVAGLVPFDYYGTMTWQQVQRRTGTAAGMSPLGASAFGAS